MIIAYLDNHARILGKQCLHHVFAIHVVEVDAHTAIFVSETHLQQRGNHTACRDVVSSHNPTASDEFLNGIETLCEVFGILHGGNIISYFA